jgi:hypothetical protein
LNFEDSLDSLNREGFSWQKFREYFPFGDISLREGNFQKLVGKLLDALPTKEQKELLLDMLDTQNAIFLEQVWLQNEQAEDTDDQPFKIYGHFISAQLQITSNFRYEHNLTSRDTRAIMLKLSHSERLLDRINLKGPGNE